MRPLPTLNADDRPLVLTGVALLVAVPLMLVIVDGRAPTGPGSALIVSVLLFAISLPLLSFVAGREGDPTLFRFLTIALCAKLAGGFARYYLTAAAYGGFADAARYDRAGRDWAGAFHDGRPVVVVEAVSNFGAGTKALSTITGLVYTATGRNMLTGFVVFSWLGFWGLVMMYRAFRAGLPDGDHRRYRLLLFFLPSLVFWPSSIGKDAWMQLSLGAVFLGVAWLTRSVPRWSGVIWLVIGLAAAALVRPHIALAALAPLAVALGVRQRTVGVSEGQKSRAGFVRIAGLVVLAGASIVLLNRLGTVFGGGDPAAGSVTGVLDTASTITAQGGSEFEATEVGGLEDLPMATISVLFRPFLWEANSVVKAIAGLETTLLLVLTAFSWGRLRTLPGRLRRNRYLVYVTVFAVVSIVGFSRVGNEGILARQRTQFLPAVLVLLCLPTGRREESSPGLVVLDHPVDTVPGRGTQMTTPSTTPDELATVSPRPADARPTDARPTERVTRLP